MTPRYTRRQSQRRSQRVRENTLGTHVPTRARRSAAPQDSMSLGSRRTADRTRAGEINQVMPATSTRESSRSHARRSRQRGLVLQEPTGGHWRRALVMVAVLLAVVLIVGFVSTRVYASFVGAKLHTQDPALEEVLVAPESDEDPYYVLIAGEFRDAVRDYDGPHLVTLVRIDPVQQVVTFVSIPANIEMFMSDENYHVLSYAQVLAGDAGLVSQVETLMGVEIAHYLKTDSQGFMDIVDALGGITVNLAQEVDDPDAGSIYIPAGVQTLDGQQALTLVRADNYITPLETRAQVQAQVLEALIRTMLGKSRVGLASSLDKVAGDIETDMTFAQVSTLLDAFGSGSGTTVYQSMVPGTLTVDPDGTYFSIRRAALDNMMAVVDAGQDPDTASSISGLTPSLVSVSVRNGAGVAGGAAQMAELLEAAGYQVPDVGNANNYVYDETLVVYNNDLMLPTAEDIRSTIGKGRVIEAGMFYEFDTDILVIIGKDWTPTY